MSYPPHSFTNPEFRNSFLPLCSWGYTPHNACLSHLNDIVSKRKQADLRSALKKRSLRSLTQAVKKQIVVLLPRHGCTVWEFGMWLLIQLSLRGNAVVLDIIRYKVKSQDNSDSFTNDEMNEKVRDSITLDNVAEVMERTVPNSGLPKENVLRVAAAQVGSFNVNASTSSGGSQTLPIPDGYEKRYYWSKSRTKGRKSKRKFIRSINKLNS